MPETKKLGAVSKRDNASKRGGTKIFSSKRFGYKTVNSLEIIILVEGEFAIHLEDEKVDKIPEVNDLILLVLEELVIFKMPNEYGHTEFSCGFFYLENS